MTTTPPHRNLTRMQAAISKLGDLSRFKTWQTYADGNTYSCLYALVMAQFRAVQRNPNNDAADAACLWVEKLGSNL